MKFLRRFAGGFFDVDERRLAGLEVSVALSADEVVTSARLVHDSYVARGILKPHPLGVRVTAHGLLPTTLTFVAREAGEVVGTLSLVIDGGRGLPMDSVYRGALDGIRKQGRRVAEVGALCVVPTRRSRGISFLLYKLMWRTAEAFGIDDLTIAVHPSVAFLYQVPLQFEPMGEETCYPGLNRSARAVALRLDLRTCRARSANAFGERRSRFNPYYLFADRVDAGIRVPNKAALELHAQARLSAAQRLRSALGMRAEPSSGPAMHRLVEATT